MAKEIFYSLFLLCIARVSRVVAAIIANVRWRRKSRRIKRELAEYLRKRAAGQHN